MSTTYDFNQESLACEIDFKELIKNCKSEKDLVYLTKEFMKNMIENMLKSELEEHIETHGNTSKNGTYKKSVRSDSGKLGLNIPRDRNSSYKPQIIPKGKTTISGIDDKIIFNVCKRDESKGYRTTDKRNVQC